MKPTRRKSKFAVQEDSDPLSVVVNLFDVAMEIGRASCRERV